MGILLRISESQNSTIVISTQIMTESRTERNDAALHCLWESVVYIGWTFGGVESVYFINGACRLYRANLF
jgi:hypothetical protein